RPPPAPGRTCRSRPGRPRPRPGGPGSGGRGRRAERAVPAVPTAPTPACPPHAEGRPRPACRDPWRLRRRRGAVVDRAPQAEPQRGCVAVPAGGVAGGHPGEAVPLLPAAVGDVVVDEPREQPAREPDPT